MEVRLVVLRGVVVDDDVDALDVEAAGRDVGRDERLELALGEVVEGLLARRLAEVPVDRCRAHALSCAGRRRGGPPPAWCGTNTRALLAPWAIAPHDLRLVELVDLEEVVLHLVDGHLFGLGLVKDGVGEVAVDEPVDRRVERRREQQGLVRPGDVAEQPLDLGHEPHVRHAVRLVDDERRDLVERDRPAVDEVDEPSRRRDDDVEAPGQLRDWRSRSAPP